GLLATLGGQTGLNLAAALDDAGVLERHGVRVLGTPLAAIRAAEDRQRFKDLLVSIGEPAPESMTVSSIAEARAFRERLGLPLVVRPAFTLGGTGGGLCETDERFLETVSAGLAASPINQVLVERSVAGWREIEYEVMRDASGTCITVCNMENLDPMGVHTGDSIVVAPSQTLTDREHQQLRSAALRIISALDIAGGCNVQFALAPDSHEYFVIEVNPRVSRSSALASKATGYPIPRVAATIAVCTRSSRRCAPVRRSPSSQRGAASARGSCSVWPTSSPARSACAGASWMTTPCAPPSGRASPTRASPRSPDRRWRRSASGVSTSDCARRFAAWTRALLSSKPKPLTTTRLSNPRTRVPRAATAPAVRRWW